MQLNELITVTKSAEIRLEIFVVMLVDPFYI